MLSIEEAVNDYRSKFAICSPLIKNPRHCHVALIHQ